MVSTSKKKDIQEQARTVLNDSYKALNTDGTSPHLFLRTKLKDIVTEHLDLELIEEPEIHIRESASPVIWVGGQLAGMLERLKRRITIATKHPLTAQRFTLAHEVGHWFLHEGIIFFRERPMFDTEFARINKPDIEREADIFAAEFLMPQKLVNDNFEKMFGDPISLSEESSETLYDLSNKEFSTTAYDKLKQGGLRRLSMVLSQLTVLGSVTRVTPLHAQFGVSPEAMAIRLEELSLARN